MPVRAHAQDDAEFPLDPPDLMPLDEDAGGEGGKPLEAGANAPAGETPQCKTPSPITDPQYTHLQSVCADRRVARAATCAHHASHDARVKCLCLVQLKS